MAQSRILAVLLASAGVSSEESAGATGSHLTVDSTELATATGNLAGAFKRACTAPTTAALTVIFLLGALIAAGLAKVP